MHPNAVQQQQGLMGNVPCVVQVVPMPTQMMGANPGMFMMPFGRNQLPMMMTPQMAQLPMALPHPPEEAKHHFTDEDDAKLIQIMEHHPRPLRCREWDIIAREMGRFSQRQCRERWHNYLKPPLDRSEFELDERKLYVRVAIGELGNWKSITEAARGAGQKVRSPAMVKNLLTNMFTKFDKLGIHLKTAEEVDCIPDVVFMWGTPKRESASRVLKEFKDTRSRMRTERGITDDPSD